MLLLRWPKSVMFYVENTQGKWMATGDPKKYCMTLLSYVMDHEDYADDIRKLIEK